MRLAFVLSVALIIWAAGAALMASGHHVLGALLVGKVLVGLRVFLLMRARLAG